MGVRAAVAVLIAVSLSLVPRAQAANPPVLVSLSPPSTVAGAGTLTLTVSGANFVNGAIVRVNSVSRSTTFIDSTRVTAQLTSADVQNAGTLQITAAIPGSIASSALSFTVYPNDPQITTLSPSTISVGSAAFILQVNGQNFAPSAVVRVNDTNRTTSFVTSRQLNVAIPATDVDRATTLFITVLNPNLQMSPPSTLPVTTGAPSPSITLLSPNPVGTGSSPVTLSVTGANFLSGAVVKANGASRPTTFVDASHLTAQLSTTDIATPTTITITVTNPSGASSGAATLNVIEANTPSILSISPGTVTAGAGPFNLTVNGSNFVSGATARAGTANRATTFVNSQQLKVAILASDIVTLGSVPITVTNSVASGGASSNSVNLFVVAPTAPVVSSLSPSSIAAGAPPFKVTVIGSGFLLDDVVLVNGGSRVTEFVDSNHLVASIPAEDVAVAGTFAVTVVRKDGKTVSSPLTFTIGNTAAPLITSLSPGNAFVGNGPFTLSIIGEGFDNAAIVSFDNTPRVTQFLSPSRLTIELSEADLAFARDIPVTVTNPGGVTSAIFQFTVGLLFPTITSISPQAVNAGDPDFTLTVTGSNFSASAVVNVNGIAHPTAFISSTSLTAAISEADVSAGGTLLVSVTDHGATSAVASLTVRQPTIAAIEPGALAFGGSAATLIVSGSGFSTRSVVVFKGVDRPTTFDASTGILIATLGPSDLATPGSFGVVVRNSINAISAPFAIQIVAPGTPVITSLDPNSVPFGSAPLLLRVLGLNFAELATVQVNGSLRATNFVNSSELDVTLLAADVAGPGQLSVVVVNPDGTRSAVAVFTVTGSSAAPARRRVVGR